MSETIEWKKCTVSELRDHCATYGLAAVGRKQELVERLEKHCATEKSSIQKDEPAEMEQTDGSETVQEKSPEKSAVNGVTPASEQKEAQSQGAVKPKEEPKTPVVNSDTTAKTKPGEEAEGNEGHFNDYLKRRRMYFGYNATKCVRTVFISPFKKELLESENLKKWLDVAQTFRIGKNEDGASGLVMVFKLSDQGDTAYFDLSNDFASLDVEVYHPRHPNLEGATNDIIDAVNKDIDIFCPESSDGGLTKRTIVLEKVPADYLCEEKFFQLFPDVRDVFVFPNANPVTGKVLLDFISEEAAEDFLKAQGNEVKVEGAKMPAKKYSGMCNKYLRAFHKAIRGEEINIDDETRIAMCKECFKFKEYLHEIINGEDYFGTGKISRIDQFNEDHITQKRHLALDTKRRMQNKQMTMPEGDELMTPGTVSALGLPHRGSAGKNKEAEKKDSEESSSVPEKPESDAKPTAGKGSKDKPRTNQAAVKRKLTEGDNVSKEKPPAPKLMKGNQQKQLQGTQRKNPAPLMGASVQQKPSSSRGPQGTGNQGTRFQRPANQGLGFQNQGNRGMGFQNPGNQRMGLQIHGNKGMGFQSQANRGPGFLNEGNMGPGPQNQGMGLQNQGNRGMGFQNEGNRGPGLLNQGNRGPLPPNQIPRFQDQVNRGPGFQNQENRGSGLPWPGNRGPGDGNNFQRNQGPGFQGRGSEGPGFQGQGTQGPGFQGQRNQGPGFQGQSNQDMDPTQRQFNQQRQWQGSQKTDTDALLEGLANAVVSKLQKQRNEGSGMSDTLSQFYAGKKDIPNADRAGGGDGFSGPMSNRGGPSSGDANFNMGGGGFSRVPLLRDPVQEFRSNMM